MPVSYATQTAKCKCLCFKRVPWISAMVGLRGILLSHTHPRSKLCEWIIEWTGCANPSPNCVTWQLLPHHSSAPVAPPHFHSLIQCLMTSALSLVPEPLLSPSHGINLRDFLSFSRFLLPFTHRLRAFAIRKCCSPFLCPCLGRSMCMFVSCNV